MAGYIYPGAAADRQLGAGRRLTETSEAEMTGWWAVLSLLAGLLGRASSPSPGEGAVGRADRHIWQRAPPREGSKGCEPGSGEAPGWEEGLGSC